MTNITIFDPALDDNKGNPSKNLGDLIIKFSTDRVISRLFPDAKIARISTHSIPSPELLESAYGSDINVIAGTNILSSHVAKYNQWKLFADPMLHIDPPNFEVLLFGVGWWQYQDAPDAVTRNFYRRILSKTGPHSLRDAYSTSHLRSCGIDGVYNTTCPTLWELNGRATAREGNAKVCLLTLTDYNQSPETDNSLIRTLVRLYPDGIMFFPQGSHDLAYIQSLKAFSECRKHIEVLSHEPETLSAIADRASWDYIGTRLHAGIWSMEQGHSSLILCVDNRAKEIGRETGLATVDRADMAGIERWHAKEDRNAVPLSLPSDVIQRWQDEFLNYGESRAAARRNAAGPMPSPAHSDDVRVYVGNEASAPEGWLCSDPAHALSCQNQDDAELALPYDNASVDAVYSSYILQRFSRENAEHFLSECHRVLRPGGVIRLAVPDLQFLAGSYLQTFEEAVESGEGEVASERQARHEYAVINLVDQLTRHIPGGEMLRFWRKEPLPVEEYIVKVNGVEALRSLIALQLAPPQAPVDDAANAQAESTEAVAPSVKPSFMQRLKYAFAPENYPLQPAVPAPASPQASAAGQIGAFRTSGEPHLWMYDAVSLRQVLQQAGFTNIVRNAADESSIANFAAYHLDTFKDGTTCKPDSLFMEAVK